MKMNFHCFANLVPVMIFALFSNSGLINATEVGKRTHALEASAWNESKWISAVDAPVVKGHNNGRAADGASWFVSTVKNEQKVISAKWMTAGLGVYELYVNGKPVGGEFLKPGFTHYAKTKRSFTYDITDVIRTKPNADNMLSVQVTPGWWADKIITPGGYDGMIGKKCAFRGVLELTFSDGTKKCYGTDLKNWKAGIAGPVKHAGIFDGEEYDAREPMGYECVDKLSTPEENTEFSGDILPSDGAEVYLRTDLALAPVRAYIWKNIEGAKENEFGKVIIAREFASGTEMTISPGETLVVDFGQNCAGVPSFVFKAAEGTVLTCLPAELLNDGNGAKIRGMDGPEGSCHRENLRIPHTGIRLDYTFAAGDNYVAYYPHCTFFGYRYVSITATGNVAIKSLKSIPVTSITKELETGTFFANTMKFFHKWMRDMRDTQNSLGGFPGVAPLAQYGDEKMRLGWADAGIIVPWTVWKQFGDTQIIEENWNAMDLFMNHINDTKYNHDTLCGENGNYQWADWLSYEPLESCSGLAFSPQGPLPDAISYWNYLSASYWVIDAFMMRDMAAATGRNSAKYQQMADLAKAYIKENFLNEDGTFKTAILNTMQTPALFALKNQLVEGEAKAKMIDRLRENFAQHDLCLQTGFLGTSILMATLTENGMEDIAYELLFQRKNPSWLYSVDNGATTIWERWNSYMIDKGMGPRGMNSFNHYAYGCVCEWIWETVVGIAADPATPGFKHIIMKPIPDKRLGHVTAEYRSAAGLIKSAWKYEGDTWIWEFTIPKGVTATVTLPGEMKSKDYGSGTYKVTK